MRKRESPSSPARARPSLSPGTEIDLEVDSLAFGGEGVARHRGLVVLVEGGLPGDRVVARVVHTASRFARARVVRILQAAPSRVPAPCPHFPQCGGCAYLSLDYAAQLEAKRRQVTDLLERIGGFSRLRVTPVVPSPGPLRYRSRMAYGIQGGEEAALGLHRRGARGGILEVESCLLPGSALQSAYLRLRTDLRLLSPAARPSQVEILETDGGLPVAVLHADDAPAEETVLAARRWTGAQGYVGGVVWARQAGPRKRRGAESVRVLAGRDDVFQRLGPFRYRVPAGSFFQANLPLAALLFQEAARRCGADPLGVLELHSGVGALSLFLARSGSRVLGVEGDSRAVRAATENAGTNRVPGVEFRVGTVEKAVRRFRRAGASFGAVVVDPPRTGLGEETARGLARIAKSRILYLSCDPATLARDLREIVSREDFQLWEVTPFDMFPQTAGIECLAELRRGGVAQERSRTSPIRSAS